MTWALAASPHFVSTCGADRSMSARTTLEPSSSEKKCSHKTRLVAEAQRVSARAAWRLRSACDNELLLAGNNWPDSRPRSKLPHAVLAPREKREMRMEKLCASRPS